MKLEWRPPETTGVEEMNKETADLLAKMLRKKLFVMLRIPRAIDRIEVLLPDHLNWMIAAEGRGQIFGSGPFTGVSGRPGELGGMTILRAGSLDEAESIALQDPFIAQGVFSYELYEWMLMEGRVTLSVSFSDCHARLY